MNSPAYDLHSPFSSTASSASSYPADGSPLSDSHYEPISPDDFVYPVFASHADMGHSYPVDYQDCWSPDAKKQQIHHAYQIPRSQTVYSTYHEVKAAPYIPPPIPPLHRQLHQNIHSPHPIHPLLQQQPSPATAIFDVDEEWHQQQQVPPSSHYSQSHLASYANNPSSPPRIKQEELAGFPAIPGYSDSHHHHQRNSISGLYDPLNLPLPSHQSHAHDPNTNGSSYPTILSPLQTHSIPPSHHSQPPSAAAYYSQSPSFQQQQPSHQQQQQNHIHRPHQQAPRSFQSFTNGGTIHPAELSPTAESCTSVSPLSAYTDLSAVAVNANPNVGCDPRFVCHQQQQQAGDLKWREDRRDSLASLASLDSELSAHSHGMVEMDNVMSMDGMPMDGLGMSMAGVVVGGMPMNDVGGVVDEGCVTVGVEDDAVGEEDAEGDEDWDQQQAVPHSQQQGQGQFRIVQHQPQVQQMVYLDERQHESEREGEHEGEAEAHQQEQNGVHHQRQDDEDGEDEVTGDESDGEADSHSREGEGDQYDSDLSESEESEDDDGDDPEFVPRPRRRPLRRQSTFPSSSGGNGSESTAYQTFAYSTIMGEGRSLRPRSSSVRYTPYPGSYPENGGYYSGGHDFDQHQLQSNGLYTNERANGRRYTSTSSSSSTHPPRSASSLSGSSGITTTTTTTTNSRRRVRPSATLPVPVPVPNLTKKSRGRRVPTMSSLEDLRSAASGAGKKRQTAINGGGKTARMYLCDVEGCGKCFARGEHLKRHVRSIHTYEKPHKCLYPGCGKDFSRHDNLGQHMRVHKDYVQEGVTAAGSSGSGSTGRSASSSSRRKALTQN